MEAAAGGTLFLDELGDIPLHLQVKLPRLLESGTFRRVGGVEILRADFRLVAATYRDLSAMVESGEFCRDLYYRLATFPIHLPALPERREDLPPAAITIHCNQLILNEVSRTCSAGFQPALHARCIGRVSSARFAADVGDVLEEDEAENQVLVLGRVHVGAQLVGGGPEGLLDVVEHGERYLDRWLLSVVGIVAVVDNKTVLVVRVPAASRKQRPVFLNGQPLGNTWRRLHDGDRHCDDETVKRMLAEQMEDSRDTRILNRFGLRDIDLDSLHTYRNAFAAHRPDHPWLGVDDWAFLRLIGGWREDRGTGEQGLTLAGLLMFGQWPSIAEAAPLYFLDYQELSADTTSQTRWLDRVVPDGSWSGNLYDFYRKVIRKLTADLKVPFLLKGDTRIDDTPVHQALREALVNTLIHADYADRASVLVIKQPSGFVFRNPGTLRVPAEAALHGGTSDCRNRTLHQMFLLINLGERAGSGLPKIRAGWEQAGHTLRLFDTFEPFDQTRLEMDWSPARPPAAETSVETSVETSARILALLRNKPTLTAKALANELGLSQRAIELQLGKLKAAAKLRRVGPNKGGHWEMIENKP